MSIGTVYILGAGASVAAGFPVAAGVRDALHAFVEERKGRNDCRRLSKACVNVVARMDQTGWTTMDDLAWDLRNQQDGAILNQAKAAMSALFLSLEHRAVLRAYRLFSTTMIDFDSLKIPDEDAAVSVPSTAAVLDYNYDRSLAAAIYQEVISSNRRKGSWAESCTHRLLNMGFNVMTSEFTAIDPARFALLKMHGQIGAWFEDHDVDGLPLDRFGAETINDDVVGPLLDGKRNGLLFFPWEKKLPSPLRKHIDATDQAAQALLSTARRIRVIGFSCDDRNTARLRLLLPSARQCRLIEVFDPAPDVAMRRLKAILPDWKSPPAIVGCPGPWNP